MHWIAALFSVSVAGFLFVEYRVRARHIRLHGAKLATLVEERTQALKLRSHALEESEKRFRQLAENIHEVFWMFDPKTDKFLYLSPAYRTLWLREPEVVLNDPSQWLAHVHPEDLPTLQLAKEAERRGQPTDSQYRIVRSDGSIRWVWNRSFPVSGGNGESDRVVGILEDITARREAEDEVRRSRDEMSGRIVELKIENKERRRAEEELKAAKEVAESASRSKSEFLANVSHEIRTPLNGITGMLHLALETELSDEQREYLELVRSSADSLLEIINDVLDFSKAEAGKIILEAMDFEVRKCVEKSVRSLAVAAHNSRLELNWYVEPDVPAMLIGDPTRLGQVLLNLVGNAVKFTESGEILVRVNKGQKEIDRVSLEFTVTDTGPGIPPERQKAIFEAFTQADGSSTRKHGGTGLGLSISSQFVNLMGGSMWTESEIGVGSTFGFDAWFRSSGAEPAAIKDARGDGHAVLAVDSNATSRHLLARSLQEGGFEVLSVESADLALAAMQKAPSRFSVLVTASEVDDTSGFELVESIRERFGISPPVLMLLNATREFEEATFCRDMKIEGHLTKPLNYAELPACLSRLLTRNASKEDSTVNGNRSAAPIADGKGLKVLLVEDNPINRRVSTGLLKRRGDSVFTAANGREALAKLDELDWKVDVVLMDIQMPEMDGYQATHIIRSREKSRGTYLPIIAVTAHAFEQDRERCLLVGMNGYVSKPVHAAKLFEAMDRAIKDPRRTGRAQVI